MSTSVNACDGKNNLEANGDGGEGQLGQASILCGPNVLGRGWKYGASLFRTSVWNALHNWQNVSRPLSHPSTKRL